MPFVECVFAEYYDFIAICFVCNFDGCLISVILLVVSLYLIWRWGHLSESCSLSVTYHDCGLHCTVGHARLCIVAAGTRACATLCGFHKNRLQPTSLRKKAEIVKRFSKRGYQCSYLGQMERGSWIGNTVVSTFAFLIYPQIECSHCPKLSSLATVRVSQLIQCVQNSHMAIPRRVGTLSARNHLWQSCALATMHHDSRHCRH